MDCRAYKVEELVVLNMVLTLRLDLRFLFGWLREFYIVWRDDRPVLEMFDLKDRFVIFCVDVKDVLDIVSICENDYIGGCIDLFETVFADDFQEISLAAGDGSFLC
ncbi:hypothetical protein KOY48_03020 [Candidatus Minimicrobia naudis]|uniref:Uncharacterized protein n=1 Tax=Candidatus Minimicrobia naudis TaxID=2841263 RepID=A0A8F1SAS6_9BACT|nr:hypothetical protein KOY48_03020 [Candidatus Minimicrobia naudis]